MKALSRYNVKEVILHLAEKLDLDCWETSSNLQEYLKCGEIMKIKYLGCTWDDGYTYGYHIKCMGL